MKRYLTEAEQRQLLGTINKQKDPLAQRDYHSIRCLVLTGARITEWSLVTLQQAEQALQMGWLVVTKEQRKGGKRGHEYLLTEPLRESLRALVMMARAEPTTPPAGQPQPLIMGRDGAPLSVRSYQARLKLWVLEAGMDPRISIHWLRHTRGMNVLKRSRAAAPLKVVQEALGHASLASTGVYTRMSREDYMADLRQIDGGRVSKREAMRAALGVQA